jgi:protein-arginine kinase activator protein McsA
MKTCQRCGNNEAKVRIVTKIGGFTKYDLCTPCSQNQEGKLKGIDYTKREIKIFPKNTWA